MKVRLETKYLLTIVTINLILTFFILFLIDNFRLNGILDLISSYTIHFIIIITVIYFSTYLIGQNLNRYIKNKYTIGHGVILLFIIKIIGSLCISFINYLKYVSKNLNNYNDIYSYCFQPLVTIFIFGLIPTLISGLILGILLKEIKK